MAQHDGAGNERAGGLRVALVTGAGTGIGRAVALRLAAEGMGIVCAARDAARIEVVADAIRAGGGRAVAVPMDVTDEASVVAAVDAAREALGPPLVVVNNAGVATAARFTDLSRELWERTFAVNVTGAFLVARACLPGMLAAGWGRIVNVGSTASLQGYPQVAHYVASKHALLGMTRALALETATRGVTVNCVCPGYVDTELTAQSVAAMSAATGRTREDVLRTIAAASPQRRLIAPEEVAAAVAYLCTEDARGVNGESIRVNG